MVNLKGNRKIMLVKDLNTSTYSIDISILLILGFYFLDSKQSFEYVTEEVRCEGGRDAQGLQLWQTETDHRSETEEAGETK